MLQHVLDWSTTYEHSTLYHPQAHAIEVRAIRRIKDGTRYAVVQFGIHVEWASTAMQAQMDHSKSLGIFRVATQQSGGGRTGELLATTTDPL